MTGTVLSQLPNYIIFFLPLSDFSSKIVYPPFVNLFFLCFLKTVAIDRATNSCIPKDTREQSAWKVKIDRTIAANCVKRNGIA